MSVFQTTKAALEACLGRALTGGVSIAAKDCMLHELTPDSCSNVCNLQ